MSPLQILFAHLKMAPEMQAQKNIIITGAARGIGRATARHLALLGHNIFLIDIDEQELKYTATTHIPTRRDAVLSMGGHGLIGYKTCDLRDPAAIVDTIQAAASFFPNNTIDVLVNNAGIARAYFSDERTMEDPAVLDDWTAYLDTNLTAPFLVSQACIPFMKVKHQGSPSLQPRESTLRPEAAHASLAPLSEERRLYHASPETQSRCIINISSFRAHQSEPNCEGYAASKAGLLGLTQAMAISGAQWGVRVNAILPGYVYVKHECRQADETENELWWAKGVNETRHQLHPTGRIGYGEDIAEAIVWLMGAGFVTGQEIVVDGGISKVKMSAA